KRLYRRAVIEAHAVGGVGGRDRVGGDVDQLAGEGVDLVDGDVTPAADDDVDVLTAEREAVAQVHVVDAAVAVGNPLQAVPGQVVDLEGVGRLVGADHQRLRPVPGVDPDGHVVGGVPLPR